MLMSPLARLAILNTNPHLGSYFKSLSHLRLDALMFGAVGAILFDKVAGLVTVRRAVLMAAGALMVGLILTGNLRDHAPTPLGLSVGFSMVAVFFACVVVEVAAAPESPLTRLLEHPLLTSLGRVSYGMYLLHFPILELTLWQLGPTEDGLGLAWRFVVMVLPVYVAARVLYALVERPALRLKLRFAAPLHAVTRPAQH